MLKLRQLFKRQDRADCNCVECQADSQNTCCALNPKTDIDRRCLAPIGHSGRHHDRFFNVWGGDSIA